MSGLVLQSSDGAMLRLHVTGYEFPDHQGEFGDCDANWLMVEGACRTVDGRAWSFRDPCLLTWEAQRLGRWLRAAAQRRLDVTLDAGEYRSPRLLSFVEPNLALRLVAATDDLVQLDVGLSHEALPSATVTEPDGLAAVLRIAMAVERKTLHAAADEWLEHVQAFPKR